VLLATAGVSLLGMAPASAHTTNLSGVATCDQSTGTYAISWTGKTDAVPYGMVATVTVTTHTPTDSTVPSTVTSTLPPNADYSFTQTGVAGDATQATVATHIVWTGKTTFAANAYGSLTVGGDCKTQVTPAPPTESTPTCAHTDITVTIPESTGVTYKASGPLILAPKASVTITPVANEGYVLAPDSHPFTITNNFDVTTCEKTDLPLPTVTPAAPTTSKPSCAHPELTVTLPTTAHVIYHASGPLKLTPGKSVTITPIAATGYQLKAGSKTFTIINTFHTSKCSGIDVAHTTNTATPAHTATPTNTIPRNTAPTISLASTGAPLLMPGILGGLLVLVGGLLAYGSYLGRSS
jgi:hypothetical protein